jgi:hypothetical protein
MISNAAEEAEALLRRMVPAADEDVLMRSMNTDYGGGENGGHN